MSFGNPSSSVLSDSGTYLGNNAASKAIAHKLNRIPALVVIVCYSGSTIIAVQLKSAPSICTGVSNTGVTLAESAVVAAQMTTTNFYVGNATDDEMACNKAKNYYWIAVG